MLPSPKIVHTVQQKMKKRNQANEWNFFFNEALNEIHCCILAVAMFA